MGSEGILVTVSTEERRHERLSRRPAPPAPDGNRSTEVIVKQLIAESFIVLVGTFFFFGVASTVGIPGKQTTHRRAAAADESPGFVPAPPGRGEFPIDAHDMIRGGWE